MSSAYWVTCGASPWIALEADDTYGDIVHALREDGECDYETVTITLEESPPSFVPSGSVVLHASGSDEAPWDDVLELLDAIAAAGDGVVFAEDRQVVLDRRSLRGAVKAFSEEPAWATALAARMPGLRVVVQGEQVSDPRGELARVGLGALSNRVVIERHDGTISIRADRPSDALVAGQVLSYAARGRAFAEAPDGVREELPS